MKWGSREDNVITSLLDVPERPRNRGVLILLASLLVGIVFAGWLSTASAQTLTYDEVYSLAADAIGPGPMAHYATRVARCESNFHVQAYSGGWDAFYQVHYAHAGLWQIEVNIWNDTAWRVYGGSLWNARTNAQMMGLIAAEQGWWNGWPYCSRQAGGWGLW